MPKTHTEQIILTNENFFDHDWTTKEKAPEDKLVNWVKSNKSLRDPAVWDERSYDYNPGCDCDENDDNYDEDDRFIKEDILYYAIPLSEEAALDSPEYKGLMDIPEVKELVLDPETLDPMFIYYCPRCKEWTIYISV